jgi:hypothetical protein
MSVIGIEIEPVQLVLTRGRDFRWAFQNLGPDNEPEDFPAGDLFFEIATGGQHNARQSLKSTGVSGGSYKLALDTQQTTTIAYDSSELVVQQRLEALSNIGPGNVKVTGSYTPQWIVVTNWNTTLALSPGTVQLFNQVINEVFDALEWLGGNKIDLEGIYTPTSFTLKITGQTSLLEQEFINFGVQAVTSLISTALGAVSLFTGKIGSITEFYAPLRVFNVEFIGELALTPVNPISVDATTLTGTSQSLVRKVTAPGRAPVTIWSFDIDGDMATIKVESEAADAIAERTKWQLTFLPEGEEAGGEAVTLGKVKVQGVR